MDETDAATGRVLHSIDLDGGPATDLGPLPDGLGLQAAPAQIDSAIRLPTGWVLLAPDGRIPSDGRSADARLRHVPDGVTVPLAEATR